MGFTDRYQIQYADGSTPNRLDDVTEALAASTDAALGVVDDKTQSGRVGQAALGSGAARSSTITFAKPFPADPNVSVAVVGNDRITPSVVSVTATGMVIRAANWTGAASTAFELHWIARRR